MALPTTNFIVFSPTFDEFQSFKRHLLFAVRDISGITKQEIKRRPRRGALTVLRLELTILPLAAILANCLGFEIKIGQIAPKTVASPFTGEQMVQVRLGFPAVLF